MGTDEAKICSASVDPDAREHGTRVYMQLIPENNSFLFNSQKSVSEWSLPAWKRIRTSEVPPSLSCQYLRDIALSRVPNMRIFCTGVLKTWKQQILEWDYLSLQC